MVHADALKRKSAAKHSSKCAERDSDFNVFLLPTGELDFKRCSRSDRT